MFIFQKGGKRFEGIEYRLDNDIDDEEQDEEEDDEEEMEEKLVKVKGF